MRSEARPVRRFSPRWTVCGEPVGVRRRRGSVRRGRLPLRPRAVSFRGLSTASWVSRATESAACLPAASSPSCLPPVASPGMGPLRASAIASLLVRGELRPPPFQGIGLKVLSPGLAREDGGNFGGGL